MSTQTQCARGILVLRVQSLRDIPRLLPAVAEATERTTERLLVIIFSDLFNKDSNLSHTGCWDDIQSMLASIYVESTYIAHKLDRILMDVDVLLRSLDDHDFVEQLLPRDRWETLYCLEGDPIRHASQLRVWTTTLDVTFLKTPYHSPPESTDSSEDATSSQPSQPSTFPVVALGGTFDHLHSGHKILLSMAAWIAHDKVIVGVTDDKLLQKKTYKEVLESLDVRTERVRKFLEFFKPGLIYDIVPIDDVCGPTATDPNIQALVVSKETLAGASAIAKARNEKNFPPLECFVIDVISATSASLDAEDMEMLRESKMSSTFIREYLVSRSLKQ